MAMKVFLSYARADKQLVRPLVEGLQHLRHTVWLDEEITGGQAWWDLILEALRNADVIVAAVSERALDSQACVRERSYASALRKPILPVLLERVPPGLLPPELAQLQFVEYSTADVPAAFRLASAMASIHPEPLPEVLPQPPSAPLSNLSELSQRVQEDSLDLNEQYALLARLQGALRRSEDRVAAAAILQRLRRRPDLFAAVAQEIDELGPFLADLTGAPGAEPGTGVTAPPTVASAEATERTEPDEKRQARITRALADAERTARSIPDVSVESWALALVGKALAATNPEHAAQVNSDAEDIARSLTDESSKATAFANVGKVLAATDPDRAAQLIGDAENAVQSIAHEWLRPPALANIAGAMATTDPDHAENIARSITDESAKATALANVVNVLVASDPKRASWLIGDAERIARSITDEWSKTSESESVKASALANVAKALAATDPKRASWLIGDAERIAQSITDENSKAIALANVAGAMATTDPDRAEYIARSITDEWSRTLALVAIAEA